MVFASFSLFAQGVNIPTSGHIDTTASHIVIYDDGGPNGNHSFTCNGSITVHTSSPGKCWRILVHNSLSNYFEVRLKVNTGTLDDLTSNTYANLYDSKQADCQSGAYLGSSYQYNYLTYTNDSIITIMMTADNSSRTRGFEIELDEVEPCTDQAYGDSYQIINESDSSKTLRISWCSYNTSTQWRVIYYLTNSVQTSINGEWGMSLTRGDTTYYTLLVSNNYFDIPNYTPGTYVVYEIQPDCGHFGPGLLGIAKVDSTCTCISPFNLQAHFVDDPNGDIQKDSIIITWNPDTNVSYWRAYSSGIFSMDSLTTSTRIAIAWPRDNTCNTLPFKLTGNCASFSCNYRSTTFRRSACAQAPQSHRYIYSSSAWNIHSNNIYYISLLDASPHSITIGWRDGDTDTNNRDIVVCCRNTAPFDTISIDTIPRRVGKLHISGLDECTPYRFAIRSISPNGIRSCDERSEVFLTTLDECIDYIRLTDSLHVHLTLGSYWDPLIKTNFFDTYNYDARYSYNEKNDNAVHRFFTGSASHTIMTDTTQRDIYTYIRCVPQGEKASLKLGNSQTGAQAESITYDYLVDSTVNDLLVLKYAIVMENPGHTRDDQPRFTLELLDSAGVLMDSTCCYADFFAADNLEGWNYVSRRMWKDWTTVGINIAPYHGQTIKVRLTNKDCAQGAHWGYSYFTIHCDNKRIDLYNLCDALDSIHMRVPQGFEYKWTRNDDTTTIGTDYDITVPVDSTTLYKCRCSFVGNPDCYFTLESYTVSVFPKAQLTYWIDTCRRMLHVTNESYVAMDSTHEVCTPQVIDTFYWRMDNGDIYYGDTLNYTFTENGTYNIWLISHLSESMCRDSVMITVPVDFAYLPRILGDTVLCHGDTARLSLTLNISKDYQYLWNNGDTTVTMTHIPTSDTTLYYILFSDDHCTDSMAQHVYLKPSYNDTLVAELCYGSIYDTLGFHEHETGLYTYFLISSLGCDSLSTLDLTIHPTYEDTMRIAVCDVDFHGWGFNADSTGFYTQPLHTAAHGCDSIVHLDLTRKTISIQGDSVVCEGASITLSATDITDEGATYIWKVGQYTPTITVKAETRQNPYILDVMVNDTCNYHLSHPIVIHPNYNDTIVADICNEIYDTLGFIESQTGIYTLSLHSQYGCDSLSVLNLTRRPVYYDTLVVATCGIPYTDNEWDQNTTGFYTHVYHTDQFLCDSILNLDLTVHEVFSDTLVREIAGGDTYTGHGFNETEEGDYEKIYTDQHGCDSTYYLHLTVIYLKFPNVITPNGDGVNDVFVINDLIRSYMFDHSVIWIYDRNGRLVFKKENISSDEDCWDPKATHSPNGTYFYRFQARSLEKAYEHNGIIEVLN